MTGGEKKMVLFAEIDDCPDIEGRADIGKVHLQRGLVVHLGADEHIA